MVNAGSSGSADALAKTAVTRGFIAESLAQLSPAQADELFLVGAYSLLDVMFETPKEIIFDKVPLPSPVKDAIVSRTGPYAPYLDLVEACEQSDLTRLVDHASALKLSAETVNRAHINALARVEQLGV